MGSTPDPFSKLTLKPCPSCGAGAGAVTIIKSTGHLSVT